MATVKYEGNKIPGDETTRLVFEWSENGEEPVRSVDLGGTTDDMTDDEFDALEPSYVLTKGGSSKSAAKEEAPAEESK